MARVRAATGLVSARRLGVSDSDDEPARYERRGTGLEFDRVAFFSDAVYAIAMTLLVVGIGVPHVRDAALGKALSDRGAEISSFFIGFAILGFYWISHHALMAQLRAINTRFMAVQPGLPLGDRVPPLPHRDHRQQRRRAARGDHLRRAPSPPCRSSRSRCTCARTATT